MREPRREPLASPSRERNGRRVLYPPRRPSLSKLGKKKKKLSKLFEGRKTNVLQHAHRYPRIGRTCPCSASCPTCLQPRISPCPENNPLYPTLPEKRKGSRRTRQLSRTPVYIYLTCSPAKMFTVRAKEQLEERRSLCRWVRRPLENVLAAGQVGRLYPLRAPRNIGGGGAKKKGRGNGQLGGESSRDRERERTCISVFARAHLFSKTR